MDSYPVAGVAAAAVLSSVLAQRLSSSHAELGSETLCWIVLPFLFKIAGPTASGAIPGPLSSSSQPRSGSWSLWVVAASVAAVSLYKAENGIIGFFPALTPLLLIAQKRLGADCQTLKVSDSVFSPLITTARGTFLAALFAVLTLSNWDLLKSALSIVPVAALLLIYIALTPRGPKGERLLPFVDLEDAIVPLAVRTVVILVITMGIYSFKLGFPRGGIGLTILLGLTKAVTWYFMVQTARRTSWNVATAVGTFSIMSSLDPVTQSTEFQALSQVASSLLALGQVIFMLPRQEKLRSALWAFSLVSLVPYLANVSAIRTAEILAPTFGPSQQHPVEALARNAELDFDDLLKRQSRTYKDAHDEYQRRYGMEPPPGFEAWYEYAVAHESPIIDDFDTIYDAVSPFWKFSGSKVAKIMKDARDAKKSELWLCAVSGGDSAATNCQHSRRKNDRHFNLLFDKLLGDLHGLPDVKFLVNHYDEPRVLVPPQSDALIPDDEAAFNLSNLSREPTWDVITKFCDFERSEKIPRTERNVDTFGLPFVTNSSSARDLCQHPEYSTMHGFALGPTTFRLFEGPVPILSTGAPSTMGDILFPSPAYLESNFVYDDSNDLTWENKRNNLYWAGSTTGGWASDEKWRHFHRQRFVELAQNLGQQQHQYLRETGGVIGRVASPFLNGRLFDVAFTRIFGCETAYCQEQKALFNVKSWADKDQALHSRLVFDIDGNGVSGRYYKLLASKSVPLKQTLFREWHDERLVPWVHYIPVSQSMAELPELVFYLTSTTDGQRKAREIAEQGREWFFKAFRAVDMSIYTYRLLLELARLQDRSRQGNDV